MNDLRARIAALPVHAIDEPDGAGWGVSREDVLRAIEAEAPDYEADIQQAGLGGPDFTPKEWPEAAVAVPLDDIDALRLARALHESGCRRGVLCGPWGHRELAKKIAAAYRDAKP